FALQMGFPYPMAAAISGIGFVFPHIYCSVSKGRRYTDVVVDLPFFIDLMALSSEAGLDFMGSLQRIVDKADVGVLADELQLVWKDIKRGNSKEEALTRLAVRLDIPEITSFVAVVRDAEETGASIS